MNNLINFTHNFTICNIEMLFSYTSIFNIKQENNYYLISESKEVLIALLVTMNEKGLR